MTAAEILNDPARLEAYVASFVGIGATRERAINTLRQQAKEQAAEIEREKERRYAAFPELEKQAREAATRAAHELAAAARALRHCCALFHVLKNLVCAEEFDLAEIGEEQAAMYAERAQEQADHFAEVTA